MLREVSGVCIEALCTESKVSTKTYYKIMRYEPVKPECYQKLLIGLCHAVTDEEFSLQWASLGKRLYEVCEGIG